MNEGLVSTLVAHGQHPVPRASVVRSNTFPFRCSLTTNRAFVRVVWEDDRAGDPDLRFEERVRKPNYRCRVHDGVMVVSGEGDGVSEDEAAR